MHTIKSVHDRMVDNARNAFLNKRHVLDTLKGPLDPLEIADFGNVNFVNYCDTVSTTVKNMGYYKQIATEAIINLSYGFIRIEVCVRDYRDQPTCYLTYSYNLPSFGRYDQLLYKNRIERSMTIDNDMSDAKIVAQLEKKIKSLVEAMLKWRKESTGQYLENHGLIKDNNYCIWPMRDMYSDLEKMKLRVAITVQNAKDNPMQPNHVDTVALLDGFTRLQEMFYNQSRGQDKFDSPIHL